MEDGSEPLLRVMSLHALSYCERLFYLEEVEEIRLADESVYAGRTLHEELKQAEEEEGEWTSVELSSETLGLIGKADALRRRDGAVIPYEHKRGHAFMEKKTARAWPADALQVSAYGMLLEEESGHAVPEGRIRYHGDNVTVRVPLDDAARQNVRDAVARARILRQTTERPPVTKNDRACIRCSLSPVCLPEEERLATNPKWDPIRLFPADKDLKTIHVVEPSARIGRSEDMLKVEAGGETLTFPVHEVGAVVLHGYPQMTTQALHLCARHEIAVHWLSPGGHYVTGITPGAGPVQRRLRQYQALSDPGMCLKLARRLMLGKVATELRYLMRSTRASSRALSSLAPVTNELKLLLKQIAHVEGVDALRGLEGSAARAYFGVMDMMIRADVEPELRFSGRNRRPPKDRFNALLSFGYALLYQAVLQAVLSVGLEPALGFYHTPRSSAHPLVLDLMELFRLPVWDIPLLGSINRLQWDPDADFEVTPGRVWLSQDGRKKAIRIFEDRLEETWKHPVVDYSLSYGRLIELEVRLLEKEWAGKPGLFGRMRIR
jgi:CRISPR-associated protein Cas1